MATSDLVLMLTPVKGRCCLLKGIFGAPSFSTAHARKSTRWRCRMDGFAHRRGRGPSLFDWLMLVASLAMIGWIIVTH
jgi:hypothetical protein